MDAELHEKVLLTTFLMGRITERGLLVKSGGFFNSGAVLPSGGVTFSIQDHCAWGLQALKPDDDSRADALQAMHLYRRESLRNSRRLGRNTPPLHDAPPIPAPTGTQNRPRVT